MLSEWLSDRKWVVIFGRYFGLRRSGHGILESWIDAKCNWKRKMKWEKTHDSKY